jgi:hypothetical protein
MIAAIAILKARVKLQEYFGGLMVKDHICLK